MGEEQLQQGELGAGQVDRPVAADAPRGCGVEREVAEHEDLRAPSPGGDSRRRRQQRPQPGEQLLSANGLGR